MPPGDPHSEKHSEKIILKNHAVMKEAPELASGASFMGVPPWLPYGVPQEIMEGVVEIFFEIIR